MKASKRLVGVIAKKLKKDSDELILFLWNINELRFGYLKNQNTAIKDKDLRYIKELFKKLSGDEYFIDKKAIAIKNNGKVFNEFNFASIGVTVDPIININHDEILKIHDVLVGDFVDAGDPIFPAGVKNRDLLEGALFHSQTSHMGIRKYPTIETSGAAMMYALSNNHPFHNGNKRTALVALLVFLDRHNIFLTCSEDDLFKVSIDVASHKFSNTDRSDNDKEIYELAIWIVNNSKIMRKDEYPITLKKLKKILKSFNCVFYENGKVGRVVPKSFLGYKYKEELKSRIPSNCNISEGTELSIKTIKNIRKDLHLDVENGIDSNDFYHSIKSISELSNEFIVKYKNLLTRLSKR